MEFLYSSPLKQGKVNGNSIGFFFRADCEKREQFNLSGLEKSFKALLDFENMIQSIVRHHNVYLFDCSSFMRDPLILYIAVVPCFCVPFQLGNVAACEPM